MTALGILLEEANKTLERQIKDRRVQADKIYHDERRKTVTRKLVLREGEY